MIDTLPLMFHLPVLYVVRIDAGVVHLLRRPSYLLL